MVFIFDVDLTYINESKGVEFQIKALYKAKIQIKIENLKHFCSIFCLKVNRKKCRRVRLEVMSII
ncbi:hypothetical protein HMPREF2137_08055 [Hoylesella buccalis DNF00853]|uniref:Uncharacterized protein n=1 Tax=Hoylesella buccalis DNF00853 TaxID=1401074 RepID=A0A095ZI53_9BACT|nr:hypothetical protein HMPREF2137_08055 [Hoylesella buccalis DNF00853]KGF42714.1 hypothetical protein HMPREF2140_00995 [Hoylesella buccalis DNF00985]